ncbi:uncharacterized protein SCHCODRAFT_01158772 [Schizophyllum commune H4-8]|uniref:uncharacterized protein n=1 Tax=Schizophyllum commune (strain H4-8 / FGSC 9210) TaxID=578458 RepID=UPI00215F10F9|nr:uncharacterized protein SCHCODRAFT_01158772 [Schizophyllum commune H4-8]KAI5888193.1 hypothetical protein SCHCODRAFT_01158772 [Schizophyllum commune H4-8]
MSDLPAILPAPSDECESCYKEASGAAPLLRCSSCKGKFYCSPKCQKQDWKAHKKNCSPLTLPLVPTVPERSPELIDEVRRVANLLKDLLDACKDIDKDKELGREERERRKAECHPFKVLYRYEVPAAFAWETKQLDGETPLQRLVLQLTRLFWIETVAGIASQEERDGWIDIMKRATFPSVFPLMVPEKVLARPGDLSPGEYRLLLHTAFIKTVADRVSKGPEKGSMENREEGSRVEAVDDIYAERWPHLVHLSKLAKSIE